MKSRAVPFLLALLASAAFFTLPSIVGACAGTRARETVLMPAMAAAWSQMLAKHVEAAAAAGVVENVEPKTLREKSAAMQTALDSGDRYAVSADDWNLLRPAALAGVQVRVNANEIGPGVGLEIVETVRQFDQRMTQLKAR